MNLTTENGDIILYGDDFDLKVASDREMYVRFHDSEEPKRFRAIGRKLESGFTKEDKEMFLMKLRMCMLERIEKKKAVKKNGQDTGNK